MRLLAGHRLPAKGLILPGHRLGWRDTLASVIAVIAALFGNDEDGFLIDADDWSTLFQDTAGTQPVTAPNQGVALALDKSGNGNHATQATTADRPLTAVHPDGGVRNEVDNSDTLATQTVTVTAQERTLSFRGAGTVTLSNASTAGPLVGTGADDIVSLTFTPTAGSLTLTVSGTVNDAMLELGAVRTTYQKRVNHLDVTEAGKRSIRRLYFNGTSHSMQTPTITPNTDKVQAFAGVRALNLATGVFGMLFEIGGTGFNATSLRVPPSASGRIDFTHTGDTNMRNASLSGLSSPLSAVLSGISDLGEPKVLLSRDGLQVAQNVEVTGGGVFDPNPAFIGSQQGTMRFFNGFLDQLITRFGPNLDTATIEKTEKYVSTKVPEVETL